MYSDNGVLTCVLAVHKVKCNITIGTPRNKRLENYRRNRNEANEADLKLTLEVNLPDARLSPRPSSRCR